MIMNDIPASAVADAAPDLESRAHSDDHFDTRLWLRLMACTNLVEGEIRSRLRTEHTTTLPRFDLMAQLQRQPAGMKMSELSRHLMVTNGNITGITDQLEKEGLVERIKVLTDRRSSLIRLTPKGKRQFKKNGGLPRAVATGDVCQPVGKKRASTCLKPWANSS